MGFLSGAAGTGGKTRCVTVLRASALAGEQGRQGPAWTRVGRVAARPLRSPGKVSAVCLRRAQWFRDESLPSSYAVTRAAASWGRRWVQAAVEAPGCWGVLSWWPFPGRARPLRVLFGDQLRVGKMLKQTDGLSHASAAGSIDALS